MNHSRTPTASVATTNEHRCRSDASRAIAQSVRDQALNAITSAADATVQAAAAGLAVPARPARRGRSERTGGVHGVQSAWAIWVLRRDIGACMRAR